MAVVPGTAGVPGTADGVGGGADGDAPPVEEELGTKDGVHGAAPPGTKAGVHGAALAGVVTAGPRGVAAVGVLVPGTLAEDGTPEGGTRGRT